MQPPLELAASGARVGAMAKLHTCTSLSLGMCMAAAVLAFGFGNAQGAECKRKTAGFYLQDTNAGGPKRLSLALQSIPVSLTGALGDPERGREILVNRQKGDCLSCHKVTTLSSIADQGSIGPSLDGIGGRYADAQLRQVLVEPKVYFPNTIMPSYYKAAGSADASVLTAPEVEDLVAYMKTLK
jgi:L-cysteine S-thiosulfotransferase